MVWRGLDWEWLNKSTRSAGKKGKTRSSVKGLNLARKARRGRSTERAEPRGYYWLISCGGLLSISRAVACHRHDRRDSFGRLRVQQSHKIKRLLLWVQNRKCRVHNMLLLTRGPRHLPQRSLSSFVLGAIRKWHERAWP